MCLAIPAKIEEIDGEMARLRVGDTDSTIRACLSLLPEPGQIGEYVIVHAGFAMHKVNEKDALETIQILRDMAQLLHEDFGDHPVLDNLEHEKPGAQDQ